MTSDATKTGPVGSPGPYARRGGHSTKGQLVVVLVGYAQLLLVLRAGG